MSLVVRSLAGDEHKKRKQDEQSPNTDNSLASNDHDAIAFSRLTWVAFKPIDSIQSVACDLRTMEYARPALYLQVVRDKPDGVSEDGLPMYRCSYTRAQLCALITSFNVGYLVVSKDIDLDELIAVCDQQSVSYGWTRNHVHASSSALDRHRKSRKIALQAVCTQLALAICYWEDLADVMDACVHRSVIDISNKKKRTRNVNIDVSRAMISKRIDEINATTTRAWICFAAAPQEAYLQWCGELYERLLTEWPGWLDYLVKRLAVVFDQYSFGECTPAIFTAMIEHMEQTSPLSTLWFVASQNQWHEEEKEEKEEKEERNQKNREMRKKNLPARQKQFLDCVKSTARACVRIGTNTHTEPHSASVPHERLPLVFASAAFEQSRIRGAERAAFARMCVQYCHGIAQRAVNYQGIFSDACADASGFTTERTLLEKAFNKFGVRILRWSSDTTSPRRPLMFPPYMSCQRHGQCTCMLIEFAEDYE